jgi:hypothetical protein
MSGKGNCSPSRDHAAHNPAGQLTIPRSKRSSDSPLSVNMNIHREGKARLIWRTRWKTSPPQKHVEHLRDLQASHTIHFPRTKPRIMKSKPANSRYE